MFLQQYIQWGTCCSGNVDVLHRNRKCFFSRHVQFDSGYNVMTTNEFSCDRPEVILSFLIIARRVVLKLGWRISFIWLSLKNFLFFSSFRSLPSKGGCSQTRFHLLQGIGSFHFFAAWTLSLLCVFVRGVQMCPSPPTLPCLRPACKTKPRNIPGKTFEPNWCSLDWTFAEIGWYSTTAPNGITGPLKGIPNRLSHGVFPSDKRSWMFRRKQEHSIESDHHSLPRPDCNSTADVPSFTLRTALSAIPFVSDLGGVDVQWFQEGFSQALPNTKELSV